jgi:hypothetical protein
MITYKKDAQGNKIAVCDCGAEIEHEVGERNGEKMCLVCFFSDKEVKNNCVTGATNTERS